MRVLATFVFAVTCIVLVLARSNAVATTSHVPCPQIVDPDYTPVQSFETPVTDARTLAFIALLENQNTADQRGAIKRTAGLDLNDNSLSTLSEAVERNCANTDVHLWEKRLKYALAARWGHASDSLYFQFAGAAISLAVTERISKPGYAGQRIPVSVRDRSLAVFGTSTAKLGRMIATPAMPPTQKACNVGAAVTKAIAPDRSLKDSGDPDSVDVDVSLDEHGFVRFAKPHDANVMNRSADIVSASVFAAAVSTYTPAFANCKPVASDFLFHVVF